MTDKVSYLEDLYQERSQEMTPVYENRDIRGTRVEIDGGIGLPVRFIVNRPKKTTYEKLPVYINLHGGAFAEGDAVLMDGLCQKIANTLGILVLNLNYRLFPDVRYPYPLRELNALYTELKDCPEDWGIDPEKIAVGGFSAGATIAFGSEIDLLQSGQKGYRCIVGGYPMTSGREEDIDVSSEYKAADGDLGEAMKLSMEGYENDPICSSLLAADEVLCQISAAVIVTCGRDDLGNMGRQFVEKLQKNQVPYLHRDYEDAYHGFIEANQPDFFMEDYRKIPEQRDFSRDAEQFIMDGLKRFLLDPS